MHIPIRLRLSLDTLLVLLIGMGLAGMLAWLAVERLYLDTQRENLLVQARLTAAGLEGTSLPEDPSQPYLQTLNALPGVHTRLLGESGAVVVGLPLQPEVAVPAAENSASVSAADLLQRLEIRSALQGTPATAVRRVASAGDRRVLYAAAPVYSAQGEVTGIVYLATPLPAGGLPLSLALQLAGALLAAVLLAGVAGTLLARRIARPIEGLTRLVEVVAAGDLEQNAPMESGIGEIHALGQAFNAMTASLRRSDQAKNAFIADVTHELRTPLTVIKGTIETLEDGALDDAEGRGPLLASMQRETDRLIRLVNDLLVLTRADAGALRLKAGPFDLAGLARTRCESLSTLAKGRGASLRVEARDRVEVQGDADRLAQVLDNLLDNAIRYTAAGSTVRVTIRGQADEVECSVSDAGPGIPAGSLPFIFERFYRVDASRNRQSGGTGLGLAIVRALVLAHGGRVAARSVEGRGTTITFWLPTATRLTVS
ncbi:MAG: ATP-binding protein [Chloroflexota bacterium]